MLRANTATSAVTSIPGVRPAVLATAAALMVGCATDGGGDATDAVAYEGARVIAGDGSVIESGVFVVEAGTVCRGRGERRGRGAGRRAAGGPRPARRSCPRS